MTCRLTVKDKNGVSLGTVVAASSTPLQLRSSTGYFYSVLWTGAFVASQLYYSADACTGTGYLNAGTTDPRYYSSKFAIYLGPTASFSTVSSPDANGNATNQSIAVQSIYNANGTCSTFTSASYGVFTLTAQTKTTLGIPTTITPPFTVN